MSEPIEINTYDIGDRVKLTLSVTASEVAVDPSTITITVKHPSASASGPETSYVYGTDAELVKTAVGTYHAWITPDAAGYWHYRWETTGDGEGAEENYFKVRKSKVL